VEPGTHGGTVPPTQEGDAAFTKDATRKDIEMTTEISTATTPARGLALSSFDDAFRFSKMVAASEFAPKEFKGKPESCLLAIQHGSEVGLSPMQSLQSIAVINGRPTIWGDAALALVQSSPVCEYVREFIEGEGEALVAVCEAKRKGYPQPTVVRFSMADAKRAGLAGKTGPWSQYPARMLTLRARGFALRNAFADALRGLITAEEAQDYPAVAQVETKEPVVVRPKFDAPLNETTKPPVEVARELIRAASSVERLAILRTKVEARLKDKTLSSFEADELFDECQARQEFLEEQEVPA
jgi:hypothetical protein